MKMTKKILSLTLGSMFLFNVASACTVSLDSDGLGYTISPCPRKQLDFYKQGLGYASLVTVRWNNYKKYELIRITCDYGEQQYEEWNAYGGYYGTGTKEGLFSKVKAIYQIAWNHRGRYEDYDLSEAPAEIAQGRNQEREFYKDIARASNPFNNILKDLLVFEQQKPEPERSKEEVDKELEERSLTTFKLDKETYNVKLVSTSPIELSEEDYTFNAEEEFQKFSKEEKQIVKHIKKGVNATLAKFFAAEPIHNGCLLIQKMRHESAKQNVQAGSSVSTVDYYVCKFWIGRKKPAKGLAELLTKAMGINDTFEEIYPALVVYTIENGKVETVYLEMSEADSNRLEKIYKQ